MARKGKDKGRDPEDDEGLLLTTYDMDSRTVEFLASLGIEKLYPPQAEGMKAALMGDNLVLAVPTATGKSAVAYAAAAECAFAGKKALYIVPLRALASEKFEELSRLERYGLRVGLSVGDYDAPDPRLEDTDIVVATAEKADSMLRHKVAWLDRLGIVVSDEVHLIGEPDRGPTLEVLLARFMALGADTQLVALSATISNADELYAAIPVFAAKFEGKLEAAGELRVDMSIVGTFEAEQPQIKVAELEGTVDVDQEPPSPRPPS